MSVPIGWAGEIPNWISAAAKAPSNQQLTSLQIKRRKVQSVQKEGCVWGEGAGEGRGGGSSNRRLISPGPATANTGADRLGNALPRERCASALRLDPRRL